MGTFVSRAQATYAQSLLEAGGIGSHLIDGSAEEDALDEAQVSLWAPSADYDLACQLLESRVEDILTHSA